MKDCRKWNRIKTWAKLNGIENWYDIYLEYWKSGGRNMIPEINYDEIALTFLGFTLDRNRAVFEDKSSGKLHLVDRLLFHRAKKLFNNTDYDDIENVKFTEVNIEDFKFHILGGK